MFKVVATPETYTTVRAALEEGGFQINNDLSGLELLPLAFVEVRTGHSKPSAWEPKLVTPHAVPPSLEFVVAHRPACAHDLTTPAVSNCLVVPMQTDDEARDLNDSLMEKLLELDDVDAVFSNQKEGP